MDQQETANVVTLAASTEFPTVRTKVQPHPNPAGADRLAQDDLATTADVAELRRAWRAQRRTIARMRDQFDRAAALQRDLQAPMPPVAGAVLQTLFRPAGDVSGDSVHAARLDESNVAIVLADAAGHDLAAGMLSMVVMQSLRSAGRNASTGSACDPARVLLQANEDLLDAGLTDGSFVTAVYAVYHETTRTLRWARAGAPHPILVRRHHPPNRLASQGVVLGAVRRPHFETGEVRLQPGDAVVFHTDGLDDDIAEPDAGAFCRALDLSAWLRRVSDQPTGRRLEELDARIDALDRIGWQRDDISVLTLSIDQTD